MDPKKLRVGDVVVFGHTVKKCVKTISDGAIGWTDGYCTHLFDVLWQIAKLDRPLPNHVLGYKYVRELGLYEGWRYKSGIGTYAENYTPTGLRLELRRADKELEDAGVTL
jgi:hypothetical protein